MHILLYKGGRFNVRTWQFTAVRERCLLALHNQYHLFLQRDLRKTNLSKILFFSRPLLHGNLLLLRSETGAIFLYVLIPALRSDAPLDFFSLWHVAWLPPFRNTFFNLSLLVVVVSWVSLFFFCCLLLHSNLFSPVVWTDFSFSDRRKNVSHDVFIMCILRWILRTLNKVK